MTEGTFPAASASASEPASASASASEPPSASASASKPASASPSEPAPAPEPPSDLPAAQASGRAPAPTPPSAPTPAPVMPLVRLAWRNLWRHRQRTILLLVVVAYVTLMTIGYWSFVDGYAESVVESYARYIV